MSEDVLFKKKIIEIVLTIFFLYDGKISPLLYEKMMENSVRVNGMGKVSVIEESPKIKGSPFCI